MFNFILLMMRAVFLLLSVKQINIAVENAILKKENEILKRKKKDRIKFKFFDRLFYAVICYIEGICCVTDTKRPHQGIEQRVPKGHTIRNFGRIQSKPNCLG